SELMRGNGSPLRTRRSSASDDGRVLVGSSPTRLYIVRTAATSAGGCWRTSDSASASCAVRRGSRSTTCAPPSQATAGRHTAATSAATLKRGMSERALALGAEKVDDPIELGHRVWRNVHE